MGFGSYDLLSRDPKETSFFSSTLIQGDDSVKIAIDLESLQGKFCLDPWPATCDSYPHSFVKSAQDSPWD